MAMKLVITEAEHGELNEDFQKEYTKNDAGEFHLDTIKSGGLAVENVDGLKKTINTIRSEKEVLVATLKTYDGIEDPELARTALETYDEYKNFDIDGKVKLAVDAQLLTVNKKHSSAIDLINTNLANAETQLSNALVKSSATQALQEADGNVRIMMPHVMARVTMQKTADGQYTAQVLDDSGQPAIGDGQGNPMTIPQLVADMKQDESFAAGFKGTGSTGSESGGGGQSGTPKPPSGTRTIAGSDQSGMNASIEDIASGKATVDMTK